MELEDKVEVSESMRAVLDKYLKSFREIVELTVENGWVDNSTLQFSVLEISSEYALLELNFIEIVMSASGCTINREERWGRVKLKLENEAVVEVEVL